MLTTAYHPQSNGMVERFHRQLKVALCARCSGVDWLEHLPGYCWAYVRHQRKRQVYQQLRPHMGTP